jgi:arylsulfatase A-like enzyme
VHTPNLDHLATEGVCFDRAFSTAPVCSPSRSAIITGCLAETTGAGHHRSRVSLPGFIKGFPYYLKQAGYYTTNNMKTDYNIANDILGVSPYTVMLSLQMVEYMGAKAAEFYSTARNAHAPLRPKQRRRTRHRRPAQAAHL